jgi:hypothetical protein
LNILIITKLQMTRTWNESDMLLAVQIVRQNPKSKITKIARIYRVPRTTLSRRVHGILSKHDTFNPTQKLTKLEEEVIVQYILNLDSRAFPPRRSAVEDMANRLLAERDGGRVGKNWTSNFVQRQPQLSTRFTRKIDYQRVKCEDPDAYNAWFRLVRNMISKYGIHEEDIYNFDETGFLMGQISSEMVVTNAERKGRPRTTQQGNREWITVIQGVGSYGYALPPFIICAGKNHLSTWYEDASLPPDWVIAVTSNGWTTNERGLDWIKHFNQHTKSRTKGGYRLLIIDGHESHRSAEFEIYCTEQNIITLCMPAHSSHKLQPLDVGCFSPLKRSYGTEIEKLMRAHITHISKEDFFPAFRAAFQKSITTSNIQAGFRATGLVPYNPDYVISQLDVRLRTPTPAPAPTLPVIWEPRTPRNILETQSQSTYLKDRIVRHQNSSPTSLLQSIDQVAKGAESAIHELTLLREENAALRKANDLLSRRRRTKKRRLQEGGVLTVEAVQDSEAQREANIQLQADLRESRGRTKQTEPQKRCCRCCGQTGHNIRTCPNVVDTSDDSNAEELE